MMIKSINLIIPLCGNLRSSYQRLPDRTEKLGTCVSASPLEKATAHTLLFSGDCRPTTDLSLRVESDRSNMPRCSASTRLGVHSESHGNEVSFEEITKAYLRKQVCLHDISDALEVEEQTCEGAFNS